MSEMMESVTRSKVCVAPSSGYIRLLIVGQNAIPFLVYTEQRCGAHPDEVT